jgi:hypothetical protein
VERSPVQSSSIETIGYDSDSETLEVEFKNGSVYQYFDVPHHVYEAMLSSGSVGSYLAQSIKGVYRFSRT